MYDYAPLNPALITSILLQSEPFLFVQRLERRRVRGTTLVRLRKSVKGHGLSSRKHSNLPDLTPHCRSDTFLPYPTLCCSARLGENLLSCCPSPLGAQELLPARLAWLLASLLQTPLVPAPEGFAEKVGAGGEKLALSQPFFGLL